MTNNKVILATTYYRFTTSYYNHQQLPAFYLARGNQVLINEMNHFTLHSSGNLTAPGGH
ncbi:MAG: hypothetical protein WBZ36_29840 [Candidatus Nitrosopolaris sp.]